MQFLSLRHGFYSFVWFLLLSFGSATGRRASYAMQSIWGISRMRYLEYQQVICVPQFCHMIRHRQHRVLVLLQDVDVFLSRLGMAIATACKCILGKSERSF